MKRDYCRSISLGSNPSVPTFTKIVIIGGNPARTQGRKNIVDRYDNRLDEQDAKIQQLLSMLCMTLRAQDAILEALVEQGIGNGEIKSMHKELKGFILDQVQ